ncbi:hypothetical protein TSMEX_000548 [Taenia solium]|eukprot:TsM_000882400 transcript=TsM_000882400 gene=TsM_000882400
MCEASDVNEGRPQAMQDPFDQESNRMVYVPLDSTANTSQCMNTCIMQTSEDNIDAEMANKGWLGEDSIRLSEVASRLGTRC